MSRATGDITETERFVGIGLMDCWRRCCCSSGVVMAMLLQDVPLALLALIPLPILLFTTLRFGLTVRAAVQAHVQIRWACCPPPCRRA
jgi:ATP-binding cassette subfamily B multidrug efflux pump